MATPVQRPGELISGINVTPLVDVMLVLLVVMMVTGQYLASQAVPVDLPKASSGETKSPTPLAVSVEQWFSIRACGSDFAAHLDRYA